MKIELKGKVIATMVKIAGSLQNRLHILLSRRQSGLDSSEALQRNRNGRTASRGQRESRMCHLFFIDPAFLAKAAITLLNGGMIANSLCATCAKIMYFTVDFGRGSMYSPSYICVPLHNARFVLTCWQQSM